MLLSHRQTLSRKEPVTVSAYWQWSNTLSPCLLPHSSRAAAPNIQVLTLWSIEKGLPLTVLMLKQNVIHSLLLKATEPCAVISPCSCEQQFGLWMQAAHISSAFTARANPCWRASMLKYNLCKETKQIRGMTFCNFFVGYNLSSVNFTADTS